MTCVFAISARGHVTDLLRYVFSSTAYFMPLFQMNILNPKIMDCICEMFTLSMFGILSWNFWK